MATVEEKLTKHLAIQAKEIIRLEEEIEQLKAQLAVKNLGWNALREQIVFELKEPLSHRGYYKNPVNEVSEGISRILKATFELKSIKDLGFGEYQKAKELTEYVINFVKGNCK